MRRAFADFTFLAGELPKELFNLISLTELDLGGNKFRGELYAPAYTRCVFADISTFSQESCPRSSATS